MFHYSDVISFADLPIKNLRIDAFCLKISSLQEAVDAISKIKALKSLEIVKYRWYKFTPDDFVLFKHLPVKTVHLAALKLSKQNSPKFRQVMSEMKIEKLAGTAMTKQKKHKLGIRFRQHGPGGIYWTV